MVETKAAGTFTVDVLVTSSTTLTKLYGWGSPTSGDNGSNKSWNVSVARNGGSSLGSCHFAGGTSSTGSNPSCPATITSTTFAAGDTVTFTITPGSGAADNVRMSVAVGP